MKRLWWFVLFFVVCFGVLLIYLSYLRKGKVLSDTESKELKKCELVLSRFDGRSVGCNYERVITSNLIKRVVRIGEIESFGNSFFVNIFQLKNGQWQKEKIFVGSEGNSVFTGLKRAREYWVDADGPEAENEIISISEMVDILRENINKEVVVFLKNEKNSVLKQYNYRLVTLMLYP